MRKLCLTASLCLLLLSTVTLKAEQASVGNIWIITIDGAIGPATSDHVLRGFAKAQAASADLIIVQMNTPGGLDQAMRDIIQTILASDIPVVSYVGPKGARAASAGTYIAYASHISAMAPATNLGAATPVQIAAPSMPSPSAGEEAEQAPQSAIEKKMINDATAYIRGLAELRNRNADWAEQAVRAGVSLDAEAALAQGVIDLVVADLNDLIEQLDGRSIDMGGTIITLNTANPVIERHDPDWRTEILSIITNPSVVLILGMIGIYGIILEFYNPGSMIAGIVGVICLLLAGYAVQLLPLNYAGLALLGLGLGLMVAEAMIPSFGILGISGVIAFSIGGLMLFDTELSAFQVGLPTIAATAIVSGLLIVATIKIALKVRHNRVTTGLSALIGEPGQALKGFDTEGQVKVSGEIWRAHTKEPLDDGDHIIVEDVHGLELTVRKA